MSFWSSFPQIRAGLEGIKARLVSQAQSLPPDLREELLPYLRREGKYLRAGLILLASGSKGGSYPEAVIGAAAAVEILHLATLIHDDIVDQAALRRGEPALHRQLGSQKAVLYGDFLFAAAFHAVSRDVGPDSARALAGLVTAMAGSEIQQLNDRFRLPVSPRRILRKTVGKTALLFSLSLYVGAREGGRPEAVSNRLRRAGYALGMAFQLQDDLLDWVGNASVLGKPILEDLHSGIYTWPVAIAWKQAAPRTKAELEDVRMGRLSPEELRDRWVALGYLAEAEDLVSRYAARARCDLEAALAGTSDLGPWHSFLDKLLDRRV